VNVLGVHLCSRAVIIRECSRGEGRIVITARGGIPSRLHRHGVPASKAAVCRYGETLANELEGRIPVFHFSPGLVKTDDGRQLLGRCV
jgi:NAD(P)-dependent dehydrogenase (short-subunit alcohol dehydrogenase family)